MLGEKNLGRSLATIGIWIGVGMCGLSGSAFTIMVAFCAMFATIIIWANE